MSVQLSRLNEQRLSQLKYMHVPWIALQQSPCKPSPRYAATHPTRRLQQHLSSDGPRTHYFPHSEVGFTADEASMLSGSDSKTLELVRDRGASRLQLLQETRLEKSTGPGRSLPALTPEPRPAQLLRCDSVVSIGELTEDDLREDAARVAGSTSSTIADGRLTLDSTDVTIEDIREHIWLWCHEANAGNSDSVRPFDAEIEAPRTVKMKLGRGERRKNAIIRGYSRTEEEMRDFRKRTTSKEPKTPEEMRIREDVKQTYSAYLCQQFLYSKRGPIPDYIDNVDFSTVVQERKQEVKAWKAARKAPTTP